MARVRVADSRIRSSCLVVQEQDASGSRDGCTRRRWLWSISQPKSECGCCEILIFRGCRVRLNLYVFTLYCNPDQDDRIFVVLLTSLAAVLAEDVRASFLLVGDLNGHHQEWLGSMTTNRHNVAACDFATVSDCDQLVIGPTHVCTWWDT